MIVLKFGGTSVDGAQRMAAVARIVAARLGERPVVVTSAMAGVTNELVRLIGCATAGDISAVQDGIARLRDRHRAVAAALGEDLVAGSVAARLEDHLRALRVLLRGVRLVRHATTRAQDAVLGAGELLAQELLAVALGRAGVAAVVVDSREVLVTDDQFGAARPLADPTAERAGEKVLPLVAAGAVPLLGGYVGATREGVPTTLGRGGSDLSASIFAVALGAKAVEIWTDVDGLMTADPRRVPQARVIAAASFNEAAELAGFGASVLHPASVAPAVHSHLPVWIKNTLAPEGVGTRIGVQAPPHPPVRAIARLDGVVIVRLAVPGLARSPGFAARVLAAGGAHGLAPLFVTPGPSGIELVAPERELTDAVLEALAVFGLLDVERDLSLVAAVGDALSEHPGLWVRLVETAAAQRARRLVSGVGGASLGFLIARGQAGSLERLLHASVVESAPDVASNAAPRAVS